MTRRPKEIDTNELAAEFEHPLEPFTEFEVETEADAQEQIEKLATDMDPKSSWKIRFDGLQHAMELLKGGIHYYKGGNLHSLAPAIAATIIDLRAVLVKSATLLVTAQVQILEDDYLPSFDTVFPALLKQLVANNSTISNCAHLSLLEIVKHCHNIKIGNAFLANRNAPNPAFRQLAAESAYIILELWGQSHITALSKEIETTLALLEVDKVDNVKDIATKARELNKEEPISPTKKKNQKTTLPYVTTPTKKPPTSPPPKKTRKSPAKKVIETPKKTKQEAKPESPGLESQDDEQTELTSEPQEQEPESEPQPEQEPAPVEEEVQEPEPPVEEPPQQEEEQVIEIVEAPPQEEIQLTNIGKAVKAIVDKIDEENKSFSQELDCLIKLYDGNTETIQEIENEFDESIPPIIKRGTDIQRQICVSLVTLAAPKLKKVSFHTCIEPIVAVLLNEKTGWEQKGIECIAKTLCDVRALAVVIELLEQAQDCEHVALHAMLLYFKEAPPQRLLPIQKIIVKKLTPFLSFDDADIRKTAIMILTEFKKKIPKEFSRSMKKLTPTQQRLIELNANKAQKKK